MILTFGRPAKPLRLPAAMAIPHCLSTGPGSHPCDHGREHEQRKVHTERNNFLEYSRFGTFFRESSVVVGPGTAILV